MKQKLVFKHSDTVYWMAYYYARYINETNKYKRQLWWLLFTGYRAKTLLR